MDSPSTGDHVNEGVLQRRAGKGGDSGNAEPDAPTVDKAHSQPDDDDDDDIDNATGKSTLELVLSLSAAEIVSEAGVGVADFVILVLTRSEPASKLSALVYVTLFEELAMIILASVASGIAIELIEAVVNKDATRAAHARLSIVASTLVAVVISVILVALVQPALIGSLSLEPDALEIVQAAVLPTCLALVPATLVRTTDVLLSAMDAYLGLALTGVVEATLDISVFVLLQPSMGVSAYPWGKLAGICGALVSVSLMLWRADAQAAAAEKAAAEGAESSGGGSGGIAGAERASLGSPGAEGGAAEALPASPASDAPGVADSPGAAAGSQAESRESDALLSTGEEEARSVGDGPAPRFVDVWLPCSAEAWWQAATLFLELGLPSVGYVVVEMVSHYFVLVVAGTEGTADVVALRIVEGPLWPVVIFTMAVLESVAARAAVMVARGRAEAGHHLIIVARNVAWAATGTLFVAACLTPASTLAYPFFDECPRQDCRDSVLLARVLTIIAALNLSIDAVRIADQLFLRTLFETTEPLVAQVVTTALGMGMSWALAKAPMFDLGTVGAVAGRGVGALAGAAWMRVLLNRALETVTH